MEDISKRGWQSIASNPVLGPSLFGVLVLLILYGSRLISRALSAKGKTYQPAEDEKVDKNKAINVFPPSRRAALPRLLPSSKLGTRGVTIPLKDLRDNQIPTAKVQPLNQKDLFTSTSLLTQEIQALGRFPDYSVLSGVPHPTPAPSFDIAKATFRPFRPFRWAYHQTMGELARIGNTMTRVRSELTLPS